jgi:hypothetical protein
MQKNPSSPTTRKKKAALAADRNAKKEEGSKALSLLRQRR